MAGIKDLHELRPAFLVQPLYNSIPAELLPCFNPVYARIFPTGQTCAARDGGIKIRVFESAPILDDQGQPREESRHLVAFDVDYRLAHEYKFPTAIRPRAQEFNLDLGRVSVGGRLTGRHISAVVAHQCRNANIPLALQVLVVSACNLHSPFTSEGELDRENCLCELYRGTEYTIALPVARMSYLLKTLPGSASTWLKISPILGPDSSNLAPALALTEVYVVKLRAAGGRLELTRVAGTAHTFSGLDEILESAKIFNTMVIETLTREFVS
ncbi:hypothetical protein BDV11DRAFT_204052 [Aspergillus similis]